MGNRRGIIYEAIARLDQLMAPGQSRFAAKVAARQAGESFWTFSTNTIHSHRTRQAYQQHVLHFINWAREQYGVNRLISLDALAEELTTIYLTQRVSAQKSSYTVQAERSALRLFFQQQHLADTVAIPPRKREQIHRSRGVTKQDQHFQASHWQSTIAFLRACGLRREESTALFVREVYWQSRERLVVYVRNGKGGQSREVLVLPGHEQAVWSLVEGREQDEHVFAYLPKNMDIHSYRREYAQSLYLWLAPGRTLPSSTGRLKPGDYNRQAALFVSEQLGHHRLDVMLRHYLR
ncbi:tyrosine-type recombinase/integrase [Ktedonobacteria bacterium brp13]|nr:tyrosine-type recombinase/integrase [Ktedonobacteria bacterium brp13]